MVTGGSKVDVVVKKVLEKVLVKVLVKVLELYWDGDKSCNTWVEVAGIRVVDVDSLQKSLSCQVVVEEVFSKLKVLFSWDNPELSKGVRDGSLSLKPKGSLGIRRTGQVGKEVCVDA